MKTDIFNDLVPLIKMNSEEISLLSRDIVLENNSREGYMAMIVLLNKIGILSKEIMQQYNLEVLKDL